MSPFPLSGANPPEHTGPLPARAEVVVIGGGVIGVCAALFLARAGVEALLLEKGRIAAEQSSRNWGWIRVQGRDPAEIPIAQEAQALWPALAAQVDTDIHLTQGGVAYLAGDAAELAGFEAWMAAARPYGVSSQILDPDGTARVAAGWIGGGPHARGPDPHTGGTAARAAARARARARAAARADARGLRALAGGARR